MPGEPGSARRRHRGFIIGELVVAVLLLAVAVSSLAALMYSVLHRGDTREPTVCVEKQTSKAKCGTPAGIGPKALKSGCSAKDGAGDKKCADSAAYRGESDAVIVRSKTDSASLSLVAKKQKPTRATARPDRGFIR